MAIEIRDLCYDYGQSGFALEGVHFSAAPGERIALVGRNGAGKTTLAKACCGLMPGTGGQVLMDGEDLLLLPASRRAARVGYAFQDPDVQLFAATVAEEVAYGPRNIGMQGSELERAVDSALELTGISAHAQASPLELPMALRRMTALATTLSLGCPCLFLDEPASGLDGSGLDTLARVLDHLRRERITVITICHDMDFCAEHMDRVLVMRHGRLEEDRPARDLFADRERLEQLGLARPRVTALAESLGLPGTILTRRGFLEALHQAAPRGA